MFLVASDWHLSPASPEVHARLAETFLARARAEGATVVLNGDVFEELFADAALARAAHPRVLAQIAALEREGRFLRTRGNHDPGAGEARLVLEVDGLGRVLVMHGHAADPLHVSSVGRIGDSISRRFGRLDAVRGAARLADRTARALAGGSMRRLFRRRCLALVEREGFALGVFGHVHAAHVVAGDRYVNAGSLTGCTLEYVSLDQSGARLLSLGTAELVRPADRSRPEMG